MRPGRHGEPGDDDVELATRDQRDTGPGLPGLGDARAAGGVDAGGQLGDHADQGEQRGRTGHRPDRRRVGLQPEEHEEHRGEQVAQRDQQRPGLVGELARQGDADQERADRGRHLQLLGHARHQQGEAHHLQQQHLGVGAGHERLDEPAVAQRDQQDHADGGQRDRDGDRAAQEADAGQDRGEDRQVQRHREVFEDQQRQHHGGLAVADPPEVGQHLGGDAGGGRVGDSGHGHGRDRAPAEHQGGDRPGGGVEHQVHQAAAGVAAQAGDQFVGVVLKAEGQQQQYDPEFGADRDEVLAGRQGQDAALAEREPGQQVQRDGGDSGTQRQRSEHAEREDDTAEFDEKYCRVHAGLSVGQDVGDSGGALGAAHHHDHVPAGEREVGVGAGVDLTAPHDRHDGGAGTGAHARVPHRPPRVRGVVEDRQLDADQPLDLAVQGVEPLDDAGRAEQFDQRVGLLVVQLDRLARPVGVVPVVYDKVAPASAVGHHGDPAAGLGGELMFEPYARQRGLFDLHRALAPFSCTTVIALARQRDLYPYTGRPVRLA